MKKTTWIPLVLISIPALLLALTTIGSWNPKIPFLTKTNHPSITQSPDQPTTPSDPSSSSSEPIYWTCPMHPQIHSEKPGECPICHMKLISLKAKARPETPEKEEESRSLVSLSSYQKYLLGIQKISVERMDLTVQIPVSGRILSSSVIAFQVYESDIRYLKPGTHFHGQSTFNPQSKIMGQITSIDNIVDPTSRTLRVIGQIQTGPKGLIPETTFRGTIDISLKNRIFIPESAVLHTGHGDLVYKIQEDGVLIAQTVQLGQKAESYYEVIEGIEPGQFISSGPNFLVDSEAKLLGTSGGTSDQPHH